MLRTALAATTTAALLGLSALAAPAALAQESDPLAELCLATGIEQIDAILAGVDSETFVLGPLAPLLTLTVPNEDGDFVLQVDVTANDVREALDCAPVEEPDPTTDPTPEPTTDPEPTEEPEPTTEPTATPRPSTTPAAPTSSAPAVVEVDPIDDDGSTATTSGRQVTEVPQGSASTGAA